ncbi:MAG: hypothetical protein ACPGVH_05045 [Chitinophagales bacterium]
MEHNLSLYQIAIRYFLCLMCGMIGGLSYSGSKTIGLVFLTLTVVFFLEAILAFDPIVALLGKGNAKAAKKDFD